MQYPLPSNDSPGRTGQVMLMRSFAWFGTVV